MALNDFHGTVFRIDLPTYNIRMFTMPRMTFAILALAAIAGPAFAEPKNPTFDEDVLPIIKQHCAACHGNDKQKGDLTLATFAATMQGGSSGVIVIPGDTNKSRIYTLVNQSEQPKMPPGGTKIPQPQIDILKLWVEQGGRENAGSKVSIKPKIDIGLKTVGKGKPEGPPPMPIAGKLTLEPIVKARRPGAVLALAASPWAPLIAIGGQKQIMLYHTDTNELLGILPFEHGQINTLKFSRNGKLLLAAGGRGGASGKAVLFNIETGAKVTEVGANETDAILAADISADQTMIAVGTATKMIRIYNTSDGSQLHQIKKHTDWVTSLEFSPDGVLLATGDRNGGVFVWEANTAREFHSLRGHTAMVTDITWRDDSNLVATGSEDGTVRLWEMENGGAVKAWPAHAGGTASVRFSHDGRLASTGRDKLTKLWDANGGLQKQFEAFPEIGLRVVVTHENAKIIAGDWAGNVKGWLAADAKLVATLDTNPQSTVDRVKAAELAVVAAEAKAKQTADAFAPVKAAADKAQADLVAAQKGVADATAAVNAANAAVPVAKAEVDKFNATALQLQMMVTARGVSASAYMKAAAEVQDAATKNPTNPMLTEAAKKAQDMARAAQTESDVAKKALTDNATALVAATAKFAAAQKAMTDTAAVLLAANAKVPPVQAAVTATTTAANAAKPPVDAAAAELAAAKAKLDALRAATAPKK